MRVAEQVKVQTVPGYANGITDGMPKMINEGGIGSLYKGLVPLWARQIPYTMMKFGARRSAPCPSDGLTTRGLVHHRRVFVAHAFFAVPGLASRLLLVATRW